jgi:hypothetical protein
MICGIPMMPVQGLIMKSAMYRDFILPGMISEASI